MRHNGRRFCGWLMTGLLVASLGAAWAAQWYAGAVNVASALTPLTNQTLTSTAGTAFAVPPGVPLTLFYTTSAAAADGGQNTILGFNYSNDGTNFTTGYPLLATNVNNGTTAVVGMVQLTAAQLNGIKAIRLDKTSTVSTQAVTIVSVVAGWFY